MQEFVAPSLIIAMPQLLDPNFRRSVVLLLENGAEGSFGLVINRLAANRVGELCENLAVEWGGSLDMPALCGGPVAAEQGFLLHGEIPDDRGIHSHRVTAEMGIASDMDSFRDLCAKPPEALRVLLGYAGWGPGQLDHEMIEGAWLTTDVSYDLVFETPTDLVWQTALERIGVDPAMLVVGSGVH